jgi:hypothetical protein
MRKYAALVLLLVRLLQMIGDLLRLPALKGVGAASTIAPAPRVFSAVRGLETYSTHFTIEWIDYAGVPHSVLLTPELYARIQGPYNRRNVYGAVLAYGPVLEAEPRTRPMFEAVARYALCGQAPLLRELGIDPEEIRPGTLRVRLEALPGTDLGGLKVVLEAPCP